MKATKANFCTVVRNAITAMGFSHVMALNVVNAALGQVAKKGNSEEITSDIKAKIPKAEEATPTVHFSVKETQKFEGTLRVETLFAAWNDSIAKAEKLCPTMQVVIDRDGAFGRWLAKVATPKAEEKDNKEAVTK